MHEHWDRTNMNNTNLRLNDNALIIGAGAHKPYDFPTGTDINDVLKKLLTAGKITFLSETVNLDVRSPEFVKKFRLCRTLQDERLIPPSGANLGSNSYDIRVGTVLDNFLKAFTASSATSIDSYLSHLSKSTDSEKRTVFPALGKFIISYLISERETREPLGCQPANWIQFLIKEYIEPCPKAFFAGPPKIITFNYDRLLERYIYEHLVELHHIPQIEAESLVRSLNIIHVYGSLGDFTVWQDRPSSFFSNALSSIKVIGEDRDEAALIETKQKIQACLMKCTKIYFLGYGFDPTNNEVLLKDLPDDWRSGKLIVSSNVGVGQRDLLRIQGQLGFLPRFLNTKKHEQIDCLELLKNRLPLDRAVQLQNPKKKALPLRPRGQDRWHY
jgi:hypothetical protein